MTDYPQMLKRLGIPYLLLAPRDGNFLILEANDRYLALTSMRREQLEGKLLSQAFTRNPQQPILDCDRLLAAFSEVVETGKASRLEQTRFDLLLEGRWEERYWSAENLPIFDSEGRVVQVLYSIQDITLRVLAEKRQQAAQQQLEFQRQQQRLLIEDNPDGLYSMDREGNFTSANEGLAKIAEVPVAELLKISFLPFCHPEDRELILSHFQSALEGNANRFEARYISAKGREMVLEVHLMPIYLGEEVIGTYGISKDKTQLRKTEKIVTQKRDFLKANASFISSLLQGDLENGSLNEAFAVIGQAVGVDRMYYFAAHTHALTGEVSISQKLEWVSACASPQIDNPEMQHIPARELFQIMGPLTRNKPFMATLSEMPDCLLRDIFLDQDIKSMLVLPVFLKNELYGFIGFDDVRSEREWSEEEVSFLRSLTHNLTTSLEKKSAEERLTKKEEALRLSEQKFKALVQEGSDMIAVLDGEGCFNFVSDTISRLGYLPDDLLGKNFLDYVHPKEKEAVRTQFLDLELLREKNFLPYRFRTQEGEWRWVESRNTNLIQDPAVQGIVINSRDVTRELEQARQLEQLHERYVLAATASQDLIYDWDLETDEVFRFHPDPAPIYGFSPEVVDKQDFWENNIHPEDVEKELESLKVALADPRKKFLKTKYRFRRADGTYAKVVDKVHILRDSNGKGVRIVGAISDVTKLTEQKEALKTNNKRYKLAMKASNEVIWDWDIVNNSSTRSNAYFTVYGYDTAEVKDPSSWFDKIVERDRERVWNSMLAAAADKTKNKWKEEYDFIRADGAIRHVTDRGFISRDKNGNALRMVGAVLDVTEKQADFEKIKRQNEQLREIAWRQSHLVRTPLVRIMALMMHMELESCPVGSPEWEHLKDSAHELDRIIREIVLHTEDDPRLQE